MANVCWDGCATRVALGLFLCGVGFAGIALPLLPATPFFLLAAAAFGRSSPRLHDWVLSLPRVGDAIRDYRAGLGLPWRTKLLAVLMAGGAVGLSALALQGSTLRIAALSLGALGIGYVLAGIPTRKPDRAVACDRSIP
jgi:uncharacterized membrane protein YbaN (DUF454 family)